MVLTASSDAGAAAFDAEQAERGVHIERVPGPHPLLPDARRAGRGACAGAPPSTRSTWSLLDPALPLGLLGPHLGVPYGVVLHGAEVTVPGRLPGSRAALGPRARAAPTLVVSAGGYPAAEGRRRPAGHAAPVVEIPPGVDAGAIAPLEARRAAGGPAPASACPSDGPLVVSVSRLVPRKGMDVLIEAAGRLAPSYPDLAVAIAGDGRELGPAAAPGRREPGGRSGVLGRVSDEDRAALLGAADVFVMACRNRWLGLEQEGFGIVFLEAAAAGVPQVAGDSGGAPRPSLDGVTGLVVGSPGGPRGGGGGPAQPAGRPGPAPPDGPGGPVQGAGILRQRRARL